MGSTIATSVLHSPPPVHLKGSQHRLCRTFLSLRHGSHSLVIILIYLFREFPTSVSGILALRCRKKKIIRRYHGKDILLKKPETLEGRGFESCARKDFPKRNLY